MKRRPNGALRRAAVAMFAAPGALSESRMQERLRPAGIRLARFVPQVAHLDAVLQVACQEAASNGYCLLDERGALVTFSRLRRRNITSRQRAPRQEVSATAVPSVTDDAAS